MSFEGRRWFCDGNKYLPKNFSLYKRDIYRILMRNCRKNRKFVNDAFSYVNLRFFVDFSWKMRNAFEWLKTSAFLFLVFKISSFVSEAIASKKSSYEKKHKTFFFFATSLIFFANRSKRYNSLRNIWQSTLNKKTSLQSFLRRLLLLAFSSQEGSSQMNFVTFFSLPKISKIQTIYSKYFHRLKCFFLKKIFLCCVYT